MFSNQAEFSILSDLNGFIQQLLDGHTTSGDTSPLPITTTTTTTVDGSVSPSSVVLDKNPYLLKICFCVEKILNNNLKDVNFIGQTLMWDFLQNLPKCMPGTTEIVELAKDCSKTSLGRGRVFIRLALNEGSLGDFISALCFSSDILKSYYKDSALIRNTEFSNLFQSLLSALAHIQFSLVVKDKDLEKPNYWEEMALSLLSNTKVVTRLIDNTIINNNNSNNSNIDDSNNNNNNNNSQQEEIIKQDQQEVQQDEKSLNDLKQELKQEIIKEIQDEIREREEKEKELLQQQQQQLNNNNSHEDLLDLENALDEITSDVILSNEQIILFDSIIESLNRSKRNIMLDFGGKGSPLTVGDKCLDSMWNTLDQILSNHMSSHINHHWEIISLIISNSNSNYSLKTDIDSINSIHNITSHTITNNSNNNNTIVPTITELMNIKVKSLYYLLFTNNKIVEFLNDICKENYKSLRDYYSESSIMIYKDYTTRAIDILSDLFQSSVQFKLRFDKDLLPSPNNITTKKVVVTKIIKKKVMKPVTKKQQISTSIDESETKANDSSLTSSSSTLTTNVVIEEPTTNNFVEEEQQQQERKQQDLTPSFELEQISKELNQLDQDFNSNFSNNSNTTEDLSSEKSNNTTITTTTASITAVLDENIDNSSNITTTTEDLPTLENISTLSLDNINSNNNNNNESIDTVDLSKEQREEGRISSPSNLVTLDIKDINAIRSQEDHILNSSDDEHDSNNNSNNNNNIKNSISNNRISALSQVMREMSSSSVSSTSSLPETDKPTTSAGGSTILESLLNTLNQIQEPLEFTYKSDPTYSSYTDSYNNDFLSSSYVTDRLGPNSLENGVNTNGGKIPSSSLDSFHMISDYFRDDDEMITKKRNKLAGDEMLFINTLYRKASVAANPNSHCPTCQVQLDKLGFFKTRICYYTGQYYCTNCHSNQKSIIPARILFKWDFKLYTVSDVAKSYINRNMGLVFDIFQFNPEAYNDRTRLQRILSLRTKLHFIGEYIETCRSKINIETPIKAYFIRDNVHLYSLLDLEKVYASNQLEQNIQDICDKYIHHVTENCNSCKGKGFICEFCDSEELIFSWMKLDIQNYVECDKCHSLSHRKCFTKERCPKCIRISRVKSKKY